MVGVDGIDIDHGLAFHLVGEDFSFLDQFVGLGPTEPTPLQSLL